MKAELTPAVLATGSSLMEVHGLGPAAARILADAGDIAPFPSRSLASWNGTAPIDASSGHHAVSAVFEPANSHFWDAFGEVEPPLDGAHNAPSRDRIEASAGCLRRGSAVGSLTWWP